ncbi:restriction endonuclease subunit S [Sulfurimonas sp. CVO]|uniref:restriction endonuclease subunit S n=1 Tax=Sulfurimonas sp. CVO TaxID=2283483 RepID=UPI00132EDA75|nr:restriction endonuclease subunit S [Sulfurimonas sp. CVO]QHG91387.1 restriction endonuclease subunit S [Sulfurimonas sp. CVO]
MRSNYKRLGQFIQQVSVKNINLEVDNLLGVSITKKFIPSIANTIGTDMSTYKIVKKNQFTYGSITSRNGDKISVALLEDDEAIVSTSYTVFEVTKQDELLPEYLMMWFRREEFDRYARYMSHGSTREAFGWDEMCEVELPIPSIEKQREIVKEYHTIVDRIKLGEQLNQKLEETAQSIYKEWFVNFEFPDKNGKPYKSNGGEMVYCDELEMEIPKGWKYKRLDTVGEIVTGKTPRTNNINNYGKDIPFITIPDMHNKLYVNNTKRFLSKIGENSQKNKTLPKNSICVSCIATPGLVALISKKSQTNQQINSIKCNNDFSYCYGYFALKELGIKIKEWSQKGSIGANFNKTEFSQLKVLVPTKNVQYSFHTSIDNFFKLIKCTSEELELLVEMKEILLSKMATIEG